MAHRRSKDHDVSLGDAIQDLYESVMEAMGFLDRLAQDYEKDVHRISRYCDKRFIDEVWKQKAQGNPRDTRGRRADQRRGESEHDGDRQERVQQPSLPNTLDQLLSTLETATRAAEDLLRSQRRSSRYKTDDAAKIRQQCRSSYQNIQNSCDVVMRKHSEIEQIITELQILKVVLERNGAGGDAGRSAGGGGRPGGRRGMSQSEAGGQNAYEGGLDEPVEEWDGGQRPEAGVDAGDADGGGW
ncbi:MAG: hypothetical protein Q9221_002368 [Calogaya cf. arnoldii]